MLKTWFKIFFRNSKKNWLNIIINVSGLSLGLVGLILVLLYFNEENSYDQWNPYKDEVYKVGHAFSDGQLFDDSTHPEGSKSAEIIPEITDYLRMPSWYGSDLLKFDTKSVYTKKIVSSSPNFFEFFPHKIIEGNSKNILASKSAIVISDHIRKQLFGKNTALGKSIKIGLKDYIVSGVFNLQESSTLAPQVIMNRRINNSLKNNWGAFSNHTYYKIKKGVNIKEIENKIQQVFVDNYYKKEASENGVTVEAFIDNQGSVPFLEKLNGFRLHSKGDTGPLEGKGNYLFLMIMLTLSILIIVISSINFINLSIASGSQRAKEVGVKKVLGITAKRLKLQFVLEIVVQCAISLLLALLISELILPFFNDYLNTSLSLRNIKLVFQISLLTLFIALFIGVLFALYMSNFKIIQVLKGNFSRNKSMVFLRNLMLGVQFVISGFFIIGGLVVSYQVQYMNSKELGFNGDQVLVVDFANDANKWKRYQLVKNFFEKDPNILKISTSLETPGTDEDFSNDIIYKENRVDTKFIPVDYGHFEMLSLQMKLGRTFSKQFSSDSITGIILNETAVSRLNLEEPLDKSIQVFGKKFKVIGVVKDYHINGFDKKIKPIFYLHFNAINWLKFNLRTAQFKLKPENMEKTIAKIERFWNTEIEVGFPFSYHFVDKQFQKTYEKYKQQQTLSTILTIVVIIVALLGLFALATLTIQQRLKEVAIRKTLGASVKEIIHQLVKSFIKIVLVASLFLIPIAYYLLQNWLDNFIYRIKMPWLPYLIAPIILMFLVLIVVGLKAYNATKIDLIKYLKFE
ncbi:ABC transporter permease [uncultured Polaribacter sp.]|uniref:ABC transporter permease n=1 Tax=uncultured Polaribacter sp. TaxID=174711 RepID=UPI00261C5832|nr:ABC transporter permease [uncultured Polaribacter sp.]